MPLLRSIQQRDPACRSRLEALLLYPGVHAVLSYRVSHFLWRLRLRFLARVVSNIARFFTGVEIHPGAQIGHDLLIDHGSGVVIGETTIIGDGCTLYQGVTLGGTGKETGKRHPTLGHGVMVGAGAKLLGNINIGDDVKIASGAVVLSDVPDGATAVGVPARVVRIDNRKIDAAGAPDPDWNRIPDPVAQELCRMTMLVSALEQRLEKIEGDPS